jgi:hypothetical protein
MLRRTPLYHFASSWISLVGVVFVTTAGVLWLMLLPSWWRGEMSHPYIGILANLLLPVLFFAGLTLIPAGMWLEHRRRRQTGHPDPVLPRGVELRRLGMFVAVTTLVNLVIGSQFLYSAVSYMDSQAFCGKTCHTVMDPEYTAYTNSPHARVACTECHIGPGAPWFVKSKISGTGQVFAVLFQTYPKPIPSPVKALRPARETCQQCHWPKRFSGEKFFVHTEYAADEQNSASTTVAMMKIGGSSFRGTVGIHGMHVDDKARMQYVATDQHRQVIPQVTYTDANGKVTVFNATDIKIKPEELARGEHREMDCMDCHNRPTHIFEMPDRALDEAMAQGSIDPKLPFIKRQAMAALRRDYPDRAAAARAISASLENFYRTQYPQVYAANPALVKTASQKVRAIYERNVFPEMKITWGTYPNNLGHTDFPGCFRCHDGNHTSADGRTISNDCATCHNLLAVSEKDPKILTELGTNPSPQVLTGGASK